MYVSKLSEAILYIFHVISIFLKWAEMRASFARHEDPTRLDIVPSHPLSHAR